MDGSCRRNLRSCGGGGIIRDANGCFKVAFIEKIELGTNNGAKLQALIRGVKLCKSLCFGPISIETNYEIMVNWV